MRRKKLRLIFNIARVAFAQKSLFYRISLDKRHSLISVDKFMNDPWSGNAIIGKNILNGKFSMDNYGLSMDFFDIIQNNQNFLQKEIEYVESFSWIRDLQSIGGNNSRKYARKLISSFIYSYKASKKFWLNNHGWSSIAIGERLTNWILSYSFFASGSDDKFQRMVLSSITEQFSHIVRSYKAEISTYSRIIALKGIFFVLCSMKNRHLRFIRKITKEICSSIDEILDNNCMIKSKNPIDHFNLFRSMLEIRFMAKNAEIDLPHEIFHKKLGKMASIVRFLRLGDGKISNLQGEFEMESLFVPNQHTIDTALSLVDGNISYENSMSNYERLSTKKSTTIINTKISPIKSVFNSNKEPGLNLFDFESSFGTVRLIMRADISVVCNGFRIKANDKSMAFFNKNIVKNEMIFDAEMQDRNKFFTLAMKRQLSIVTNKPQIKGTDFVYLSGKHETYFRFVLNKHAEIQNLNSKTILITIGLKKYIFHLAEHSSDFKVVIKELPFPTIEFILYGSSSSEVSFGWSIEEQEE